MFNNMNYAFVLLMLIATSYVVAASASTSKKKGLKAKVDTLQATTEKLVAKALVLQEKNDVLQTNNEELTAQVERLQAITSILESINADLSLKVQNIERNIKALSIQLPLLVEEDKEIQKQVTDLSTKEQNHYIKLEGEIATLNETVENNYHQLSRDECSSNPCQNEAACIGSFNSYICLCAEGYTGINCETDIDECSSNPCQNGGVCDDNVNTYACSCAQGFVGTNCEKNVKQQWCEDNNNYYYKNTCYFLTSDKSGSSSQAETSCNNVYSGAVPVEVTSSTLQNNLMTFIRNKMTSSDGYFRTGGRYDVGGRRVNWNNRGYVTTNFSRWRYGYPDSYSSWNTLFMRVYKDEESIYNGMFNYSDDRTYRSICQIN